MDQQSDIMTKAGSSVDAEETTQLVQKWVKIHCQHCEQYLVEATEGCCGHIYCSQCIKFYLLYADSCPVCKIKLRNRTLYRNIPLDNIIEDYIRQKNPEALESYHKRKAEFKQVRRRSRVTRVCVGMKVDILNDDHVWCVGVIKKVVQQKRGRPLMLVQYRYSKDSVIVDLQGGRVALLGSFTNRKEVPRYKKGRVVVELMGRDVELRQLTQ